MNGDIIEIKRMLADRAQAVAEYLLPGGKRDGHEWRAGSTSGEAGKSLGVHLSGPKAGIWAEFNGDDHGDLLDLWVASKGVKLGEALEQARDWLGVTRQKAYNEPKKNYVRPAKPPCAAPQNRVLDYLREDRNIPADILVKYKIGEAGDYIVFPFLLPNGELALAKRRKAEDGAAPIPTESGCEPVLFGWQAISDSAREIVLLEGEIDALSMAAYGYPAMSIPFGGGGGAKQQWIENEFERMDRFEKIYIATDMDKPGNEAAEEIANRLGRHRCLRVSLPKKDANECLVGGITKEEIDACISGAKYLDPEGLRKASEFTDSVIELFWPEPGTHLGYRTPYGKLGNHLLFRPAEVTLWSGASGAGKSQILADCTVDWVEQGARVCEASFEMKPVMNLKRKCKQAVGVDRPSEPAIRSAMQFLDQGLLIYERIGKADIETLLSIFSFARAKYGCDTYIIDSLMRLGIESDDYNGQEKAIFRLVDWTLANNVHTHLVAHARKGDKDRGVPETEDIKGAMEIGANAFNIVSIWRNRKLEDDIKSEKDEAVKRELMQKPGVIMNIAKQRNGDFEGKVSLWFDQANYRYSSSEEMAHPRPAYIEPIQSAA